MYIELKGDALGIMFSASHFIAGHDKCSRLHGHNYTINMRITGEPDNKGLIFDFIAAKKFMREIADVLDHRVLLPGKKGSVFLRPVGEQVDVDFMDKHYSFPKEDAVIMYDLERICAEALAIHVLKEFLKKISVPDNLSKIEVGIDEAPGQGAWACHEL